MFHFFLACCSSVQDCTTNPNGNWQGQEPMAQCWCPLWCPSSGELIVKILCFIPISMTGIFNIQFPFPFSIMAWKRWTITLFCLECPVHWVSWLAWYGTVLLVCQLRGRSQCPLKVLWRLWRSKESNYSSPTTPSWIIAVHLNSILCFVSCTEEWRIASVLLSPWLLCWYCLLTLSVRRRIQW